ncbi:DeoR/GlpR family DNA-binding transcription regulator [Blastococcus sp. PRF04-17]|uniref:DeoR/GlpR family DNA-binding transcription regulator n=1 Tax=Blastococcus sp. PRF04-17 TaxID=2933797 RepID=UPI001FF2281D|nr:DeoR/GlpR family DNA-binding transcription regulator [Blastococcus sp. PRF04-17]UOY03432.1 DeoR/GlpR family DNA-binding transcription regulator [Blastococcus sp. PRF04-17]
MVEPRTRRATDQRHEALVTLIRAGVDEVETLAERVGVSASTVRRDLTRLQREGRIARTYGGALVREVFHERSFSESSRLAAGQKASIAVAAARLVPDEGSVFIDAGTTCLALARTLVDRGPMTVVTRGLEAALLLARAPDIRVIIVGGQVQPLSHGVTGALAAVALQRLAFDVAFLGADTVDPDKGLGEPTVEETHVKELVAARSAEVVLLADASKFLPSSPPAWTRIEPSWSVLTDRAVPDDVVAAFARSGIRVTRAG